MTQAELARRAGTSQATVSAYERGLKTRSMKVATRLLGVLGWELTLRSRVEFVEHHPTGIVAFWAPNRLWRVPTPDCFATLTVPDLLAHTEQDEWNLADPVREAWEPAFEAATRTRGRGIFSWHYDEDPETTDLARITWMEFLPKPPPPRPRRQRRTRFDPRP